MKQLGLSTDPSLIGRFALLAVLAAVLAACAQPALAQSIHDFHRTFLVALAEPVSLDVQLAEGELQIAYRREGQVSITAIVQHPAGMKADEDFLVTQVTVQQAGNRLQVRQRSQAAGHKDDIKVAYRLDVPYRTEVRSFVGQGKQVITGILGPVRAETIDGDIKVSYVTKSVVAQAGTGNLDLQVIGERLEAKTGRGSISCMRDAQGASAETGDGDISLMVVGPSEATVKAGSGRIDVGGVRGTLVASTDAGDLHVKAVPHDDWDLRSISGNIRIELPAAARFEINATTNSGEVLVHRDDIEQPNAANREVHQKVHGGGKQVLAHTGTGTVVIT